MSNATRNAPSIARSNARSWYDDDSANPGAAMGSLHSLSSEEWWTRVDRLYKAVEDATGKDLRPKKPPMRFV